MAELKPSLEVFEQSPGSSFRFLRHGVPHEFIKWHFHPEYELHQIIRTSGKLFVGDQVVSFRPGSLFLIGPYTPHNFVSDIRAEAVIPERDLVIQFSKEWIEACMNVLTEFRQMRPVFEEAVYGVEYGAPTQQAVFAMLNQMDGLDPSERLIAFIRIAGELMKCPKRNVLGTSRYFLDTRTTSLRRFNLVVDYVRDHLAGEVAMEAAAEVAGMSYKMFSRWFTECTGIGFRRYVIKTRINKSCEYLFSTTKSIQEICFLVGFNNVSNYNRLFRQVMGVTPTEFRHKALETEGYELPLAGLVAL